jgi:hypothetical protein
MSLTEKIPNCIADRLVDCTHNYIKYMTAHVLPRRAFNVEVRDCGVRSAAADGSGHVGWPSAKRS